MYISSASGARLASDPKQYSREGTSFSDITAVRRNHNVYERTTPNCLEWFETFVPNRGINPVHQRCIEMNNKVDTGNAIWPVAITANDNWDYNIDDFTCKENTAIHTQNSAHIQTVNSFHPQIPFFNYENLPAHSSLSHTHTQFQDKRAGLQQAYDEPYTDLNWFAEHNPMLEDGYYWNFRHLNGSLIDSTNEQDATKFVDSQPVSSGKDLNSYTSSLVSTNTSCQNKPEKKLVQRLGQQNDNITRRSCHSHPTSINPSSSTNPAVSRIDTSTTDSWYSEASNISNLLCQDYCDATQFHDNLPKGQMLEEHIPNRECFGDIWSMNYQAGGTWASQPYPTSSGTISPKALTLNVPSVSLSSSESNDHLNSMSDLSTGASSEDDDHSIPEKLTVEKEAAVHFRQVLPDSLPTSRMIVPLLASNDHSTPKPSSKNKKTNAVSGTQERTKAKPLYTSKHKDLTTTQPPQTKLTPKRIEPKHVDPPNEELLSKAPHSTKALHQRDAKDIFLVQSKLAGMSYKDIRKQGGFTEAESTLRGRFRTLTKAKSARVRKPEWDNNDIRLLKKAVRRLTTASDYAQSRVPWKQVAEYIANNGGSYHFGNATCRKKWDELNETSDEAAYFGYATL